ncbi:hypothetical protein OQA88_9080 [Cercophora sp. LCS_1]
MARIIAALSLVAPALADWQFRSRPDLSPPKLNITIPATPGVAPGYIFVAPYPAFDGTPSTLEQQAAYIFRNDGDLVWSSLGYFAGWVSNFQAVRYRGQPVLQAFQGTLDPFHGHGYGTPILLDSSYQLIAALQSRNNLISLHEFKLVNETTALVEVYQPVPYDLRRNGGQKNGWIVDGVFQELDIASNKLLASFSSLSYSPPPDEKLKAPVGTTSFEAWDYFHVNSVDKDAGGDYLVSARHISTIYKLSPNGTILWQLGGPNSTFPLSPDAKFAFQHDARFLSQSTGGTIETISLFDNAARGIDHHGGVGIVHPVSSARIFRLNHTDNTATELKRFNAPDGISALSQGNAQVLKNDNVFVNWGQAGAITEYDTHGNILFHAYLGKGVQSYRGFRYEWVGRPREEPVVVALRNNDGVSAYVSWNGDTETEKWEVWGEREDGSVKKLGVARKQGFETVIHVGDVEGLKVSAVALDKKGVAIGRSAGVRVIEDLGVGQEVKELGDL